MHKKILSMILAIAMVLSMFAGITITASAATYVKASDDTIADGDYVMMLTYKEAAYAVSAWANKWLPKTTEGFTLSDSVATEDNALVWEFSCVDAENGYYTIKNKSDSTYLKWTASTNAIDHVSAVETACYWTINKTEAGTYHITSSDATVRLANNGTSGLRAYKVSTLTGSSAANYVSDMVLYKLDDNACKHEDATSEVTTPATCTEAGSITWTCTCGANWNETINALGHDWGEEITNAATCTEAGLKTLTCSACSAIETEEIAALGHDFVNGVCAACGEAEPAAKSYELLTNASKLTEGDKLIIVGINNGVYYAMSTNQKSNNRDQIEVTVAEDGSIAAIDSVQVITLGGYEDAWTLGVDYGYLNATDTTGSNYLRTSAEPDQYAYFSIEINGETGVATIKAINKTSRNWMRYNSASSCFACYTSGQNDIYIYREIDESACKHEWSDWTVETAATCTTEGTQIRTCGLCNETETESIPATGHTYSYVDNTTAVDATCTCGDTVSYPLNTIAEAKADTEGTAVYNVKGVVTYVGATEYYIQDETGALCIYFGYNATMPEIALGDMLFVRDTITAYKGLIETTNTTAAEIVVLSTKNELPLAEVTLADLLADTTNEYLGERVIIKNLTIGVINTADVTSLTDAEGKTMNIYKAEGMAENVSENDTVNVTAIVSTRDGYQLLVNPGTAAADVVVTAEGEETVISAVTIAQAKAGTADEYYMVEGVVTFIDSRNVYIQDETGGIVVYLKANAANTAVGDKVRAYGVLSSYNGLIELTGIDETNSEFYSIISTGNTVNAQAVTLADLTADTTNEYLAEKVTMTNLCVVSVGSWSSSYKNVDYTVSDGENTIKLYRAPAATAEDVLAVGTIINIEAIVSTYNGYQLRIADASKIEVVSTCQHETTETQNAVASDCTTDGYTGDAICTVCGATVTAGEVITAPGHDYVDGTCAECGEPEPAPADYSGTYYIYAVRTATGSTYAYMSNDLGTASTKRYQAVDSTLTEAPAEITAANEDYIFTIVANEDGTYTIADGTGKYLSWTSGNSGILSDTAMNVTITAGEKEGTVQIVYGERKLALNATATNNYFAWYGGTQIIDLVLVPVTGEIHYHDWIETERTEPSCTEAGSASYACECDKTKTEVIEATGHLSSLVNNGDGTHYAQCCVCLETLSDSVEHTFVDGVCECEATEVVEPEYVLDTSLNFMMNISAGAEMQVVYTILGARVSTFDSFYLTVSKAVAGADPVVTTYEIADMTAIANGSGVVSAYQVIYAGINAKDMGDEFTTTLYAVASDGTIHYSNTDVSSMKSYLIGKIDAASSIPELKTMSVDMLNYGAAAQVRLGYNVENLVNADLTEEQLAYATTEIPTAVDYSSASGNGANIISNVSVQARVMMYLNCRYTATDANAMKYVIKDAETGEVLETIEASAVGAFWQATYSNVGAKQMRQKLSIALYEGDTVVSQTITWSVESYVASIRAKTNATEAEINMANAMLTYGDSVAAYMLVTGQ